MVEYFLFYFLYFASADFGLDADIVGASGKLRRATSLLSASGHLISDQYRKAVETPPLGKLGLPSGLFGATQRPTARRSMANSAYEALVRMYLVYFMPIDENIPAAKVRRFQQQETLAAVATSTTIFSCRYVPIKCLFDDSWIDQATQLKLSTFFSLLLCELWMGQNEYRYDSMTREITTSDFIQPSGDLIRLVGMAETHVLRMDLQNVFSMNVSTSYDEFSLFSPSDALKKYARIMVVFIDRAIYHAFKQHLYQFLRLLFRRTTSQEQSFDQVFENKVD
jgi:hypothetical protein